MWYCNYTPKQPALYQSTSALVRSNTNQLLIGPETSLAQARVSKSETEFDHQDDGSDRGSYPGPLASQMSYNIFAEQLGHVVV